MGLISASLCFCPTSALSVARCDLPILRERCRCSPRRVMGRGAGSCRVTGTAQRAPEPVRDPGATGQYPKAKDALHLIRRNPCSHSSHIHPCFQEAWGSWGLVY